MKDVRIAVVGLGYWGPHWLRNFSITEGCELAYGCDLSEKNVHKYSKMYPSVKFTTDFREVLKDKTVDAVAIATPTTAHFPLAKAALMAGKHVLVEKPMTATSKEAHTLVQLAKKHRKCLLVDHTFAYTQAVEKVRDYVKSGKLGKLLYFDSSRLNLGLIQKDANVFYDLAIHDLTILNTIADLSTLTEIYACGSAFYGKQTEIGHLHLKFKSGLHAHIHVS